MKTQVESTVVWPVVYITSTKHIFIAIPLLPLDKMSQPYIKHKEIPAIVQLLDTLSEFMKQLHSDLMTESPLVS